MKKILLFSTVALAVLSTACGNDDDRFYPQGEGRLVISPEIKSDINVVSRAVADDDQLYESLKLWISNSKGVIRQYNSQSEIPNNEWLVAGEYLAEAWAGDSVSASFDHRWFKGSEKFSIKAGESTHLTIPCRIANVLVQVVYEGEVYASLTDAKFTVGHARGELVFEGETPEIGYFMMPSSDKNLAWTFEAEGPTGPIKQEGVIENAEPATKYILTVHAGSGDKPIGGTYFDVKVDTSRERVYKDFIIELPPIIDGYDFDANHADVFMQGEVGRRSIFITASAEIVSAELQLKGLSRFLGMSEGDYPNDPEGFDNMNFFGATDEFYAEVKSHGIHAIFDPIPDSDESSLKIDFEEEFTNSLPAGEYEFTYIVEDAKKRTSSLTRTLRITDASLALNDVNDYDVWATEATISADVLQADYGNATFQYRQKGADAWTNLTPSADMTAKILGLTPGTEYEYRIISDKDDFESELKTFTTEATLQLPNSGFEDWNTSSKAWLLCSDESSMFWDSGNHGSSTMNKNITQPDETIKHSGKYSVKMASQFVGIGTIGKFAAGNAFVGQYLKTDGTDGVLGWGRPFASRPKALRGYVKYTPQAVTDVESGFNEISKGDMDQGVIYIAVLDGSKVDAGSVDAGKSSVWPVVVKTNKNNRTLFNKNGSNVIAYGEKIFTEATSGDDLIEFEIPLEYFKTDVKAVNIMVTMSASRYGDYFTGGPSTMWVDDLELVY